MIVYIVAERGGHYERRKYHYMIRYIVIKGGDIVIKGETITWLCTLLQEGEGIMKERSTLR